MVKATKRNDKWTCRVRYIGADGEEHRARITADKKADCVKEAVEFLNEREKERQRKLQHPDSFTFKEAAERYIKGREAICSPSSIREYKRALGMYYEPILGLDLYEITREDVQLLANSWATFLSPKTVRDRHGFISAVMRAYRPDFILNTALPQKVKKSLYTPTDQDVKHLIESVRDTRLEAPVLLSALASLRRSEICALKESDIGKGYITVTKAVVLDPDGNWVQKGTKSEAGTRTTYLPEQVTDRLKKLCVNGKVTQMTPNQISSAFSHAVKAAGLPHFRFHALRSYYASILHSLGVPDKYIMEWGGWHDEKTLHNHYQKAMQDKIPDMAQIGINHFSKEII